MLKRKTFANYLGKFSQKNFCSLNNLVSYEMASVEKDIGILTIKNYRKRNALSDEVLTQMLNELNSIQRSFQDKKEPRVLLIASEGPVFSSGHDLKELNSFDEDKKKESVRKCSELMMKIQGISPIVIAEVQGLATAAGCQLAASCDLVVASSKAKFETPGVKIGLFCSTPSVALARTISYKRAMHMLVTGAHINSLTALNWGLVNEVVQIDHIEQEFQQRQELRERSLTLAKHINQFSGDALSFGKKTFYKQLNKTSLEEAYDVASEAMCTNLGFTDTKEGIAAFIDKRKPKFNQNK